MSHSSRSKASAAARRMRGSVPSGSAMRMRWLLAFCMMRYMNMRGVTVSVTTSPSCL